MLRTIDCEVGQDTEAWRVTEYTGIAVMEDSQAAADA